MGNIYNHIRTDKTLNFLFETHAKKRPPNNVFLKRWAPTLTMMLVSLISYIDRNTLALLAPTILRETHLTAEQYGWIISAFSIAYMLGNPLWGRVLDAVGVRRGMLSAVSLWTAASASHALASGFWSFAAARTVLGFGEGATFPGGLRTAMQTLPAGQTVARNRRGLQRRFAGRDRDSLDRHPDRGVVRLAWSVLVHRIHRDRVVDRVVVHEPPPRSAHDAHHRPGRERGQAIVPRLASLVVHRSVRAGGTAARVRIVRVRFVSRTRARKIADRNRRGAVDPAARMGDRLLLLGMGHRPLCRTRNIGCIDAPPAFRSCAAGTAAGLYRHCAVVPRHHGPAVPLDVRERRIHHCLGRIRHPRVLIAQRGIDRGHRSRIVVGGRRSRDAAVRAIVRSSGIQVVVRNRGAVPAGWIFLVWTAGAKVSTESPPRGSPYREAHR
jgi:hypothetical protein